MSIKQMSIVFNDTTLKPTKKLIMLAIADNANDTGVAFPSWNTISQKTGLARQTLQDNLKQLANDGYIFKKNRSRKKGGRSSNKYIIYPYKNKHLLDEEDYLLFEDLYTQSQGDGLPTQSQGDGLGQGIQSQGDGLESEPSLNIKPSLVEFDMETLENEFQELWKGYSLIFLKRQGRQGGSKAKAKEKYLALRKKYEKDTILNMVRNHASQKIGHKNLQNLLIPDMMKQFIEDITPVDISTPKKKLKIIGE